MTLKFRYHWSLNLSLLYPFYLITISNWSPKKHQIDLIICLHIHTCPELHSSIYLQRLPQHHDFSQYFSMRCTCIMWGYFSSCCETSLWWLIADQIDIWPMIHDTELIQKTISKKISLIKTSLINLDWFPERCINNVLNINMKISLDLEEDD